MNSMDADVKVYFFPLIINAQVCITPVVIDEHIKIKVF